MESEPETKLRPLGDVLGTGVITGLLAGGAAGAIDAVWSWGPAGQFVGTFVGRSRFVAYTSLATAAAGALAGLVLTLALLVLSRATRIGTLVRFGLREHVVRRDRDPRDVVVGVSLAVASLPSLGVCLAVAYKLTWSFVGQRHVQDPAVLALVVIVAMVATVVAVAAAVVVAFVVARPLELGLRAIAGKPRVARLLSSPVAPLAVIAGELALGVGVWVYRDWETVKILPLRGVWVTVLGLVLAIPLAGVARRIVHRLAQLRSYPRRAVWAVLPIAVLLLVLMVGSSQKVIKTAAAYSGMAGHIARVIRAPFDRDHDGFASVLGGGDCDDGDARIHPGAPEIPDDGIDQNCTGGDASLKATTISDVGFQPVPASVPKDANVLLITIDTTRADHLGMYGYPRPTSPSLDKLAKDGVVFEHGWAHAPSTRYSMPAILTGRLPLDVYYDTSVEGWPGISLKATTIAELLQPQGFATGAITNYWYFDRSRHMDQGFAEYDNENARLHTSVANQGPAVTHGTSAAEQTNKAIGFVDKHASEKWFLWVHYYDPHADYMAHKDGPAFGSSPVDLYDGEIRYTDLHIGRLLDELRAKGLYDKTVVVVTGDHGEGFGEHGIDHHGYHLYAAQTKVPLIMRVPGLPAHRSTTPAGHDDIMPTLVNLTGGAPSPDMMGRSLLDALTGSDHERVIYQQLSYEDNHEMRAGVSRDCHVIYNESPDTSWEVYRVDRDPGETEDLDGTSECSDTREAVEHWVDSDSVPPGYAAAQVLPTRPELAHPVDVQLGGGVTLVGVSTLSQVHRGDALSLEWTFQITEPPPPGWKVFAHVEGPGRAFWNSDHVPPRPFEWQAAGSFLRYTTTLAIPRSAATGRYTVWAGLFKDNQRAHATATSPVQVQLKDDAVAATTFEVAP